MPSVTAAAVLLLALAAPPAPAGPDPDVPYQIALAPADAVALAADDAVRVKPHDAPFMRYVWQHGLPATLTEPTPEVKQSLGGLSYCWNTSLSHAAAMHYGQPLYGGHLVRIDLRRLCPDEKDFDRLFRLWEGKKRKPGDVAAGQTVGGFEDAGLSAIEPYFHRQDFEVKTVREVEKVSRYQHTDGRWYDGRWTSKEKRVQVNRLALHTGLERHLLLASLTRSETPIVRADWFAWLMMANIEGGKYYEFRGFDDAPREVNGRKLTPEQAVLLEAGADYQFIVQELYKQHAATGVSKITADPRTIEYFYAAGGLGSYGPNWFTLTRDFFDGRIDATADNLRNLHTFAHDGSEIIFLSQNSLPQGILTDNKENLVREAPFNLAADRTIPAPHGTRLEPILSCLRCHNVKDGKDWFVDAFDEVAGSLDGDNLDVFDDLARAKQGDGVDEILDDTSRLHPSDPRSIEEPMRITRNTVAKAVFAATKGMSVRQTAEVVCGMIDGYIYAPRGVTPRTALAELGVLTETDQQAVLILRRVLPRLPPNIVGVPGEDPMLGRLRNGYGMTRAAWEQIYSDAMLRVEIQKLRVIAEKRAGQTLVTPEALKEKDEKAGEGPAANSNQRDKK